MTDLATPVAPRPVAGDDELDVSIVLPVYNEKGHLQRGDRPHPRRRWTRRSSPTRSSSSTTAPTTARARPSATIDGIRLIQFLTNRGSGSARKYGTRASRGRVVVWTDVDMTYPNDLIPELVREMEGYDQVVGARTTEQGTHKAFRVPAKLVHPQAGRRTWCRRPIPDLNSGMRAFRRDVALQYVSQLPPGFSCVTTITMTFLAHGYSVKYWPIEYSDRAGKSKFHWWSDTRRYLLQVMRMMLSFNPFRVFLPIGLPAHLPRPGQARLRRLRPRLQGGHQHAADPARGVPGVRRSACWPTSIGRATRATNEVQPAAGFTRDVAPTFPAGHLVAKAQAASVASTTVVGSAPPVAPAPVEPVVVAEGAQR